MYDELNSYRANYTNERNAIARLIRDCGIQAEMIYCDDTCASSSNINKAMNALVNYFDYSNDANIKLRSLHSSNWENMLKQELDAGRPIYYRGQGSDGHAFVIDGYNSYGLFHINWGWRGNDNDYYTLSNLYVDNEHYYTSNHKAIFNLHPAYTQDLCDFTLPLDAYYMIYYNTSGNANIEPYNNVPYTLTRLQSAANTSNIPAAWRTIPSGATTEYKAHKEVLLRDGFYAAEGSNFRAYTVPCYKCGDTMEVVVPNDTTIIIINDSLPPWNPPFKSLQKKEETTVKDGVILYPNPVDGTFHLKLANTEESIQQVVVSNMLGVVVLRRDNMSDNAVDASSLKPGLYIVRTLTNTGKTYHTKFVKK